MSVKKKKSKFQNDLLKANMENRRLAALLERESQVRAQAVDFLAALLISRHNAKADIHKIEIEAAKGMMMKAESLPNGAIRITLVTAEEFLKTAPQTPVTRAIEEKLAPEPEPEPTMCEFDWHRDPNAMGVLCPECGSAVRIAVPENVRLQPSVM